MKENLWNIRKVIQEEPEGLVDYELRLEEGDMEFAEELVREHVGTDLQDEELNQMVRDLVFHLLLEDLEETGRYVLAEDTWILATVNYARAVVMMIKNSRWEKSWNNWKR